MPAGSASIVNDLIRAAASIPKDISDEDLDRHVADLLVKEAKEKESRWRELGIGVYLNSIENDPGTSALPKPNKRFLSSVIRQVDDHNTALLREQAIAAREASRALPSSSSNRDLARGKGERRPVGPARLFGGALGAASSSRSRQSEIENGRRDSRDEREHDGLRSDRVVRERKTRTETQYRDDGRRDRETSKRTRDDDYRTDNKREKRGRTRSPSPVLKSGKGKEKGHIARTPSPDCDPSGTQPSHKHGNRTERNRLDSETETTEPPLQSKMDRYFAETYDPRLDFSGVLPVPSAGLVADVGWDNMLAVLKEKGKRRRAASPGFSPSPPPTTSHRRHRSPSPYKIPSKPDRSIKKTKDKESKSKRKHRDRSLSASPEFDSDDSEARERRKRKRRKEKERKRADEIEEDKKKTGGYAYARQGATREWDVGKVDMPF